MASKSNHIKPAFQALPILLGLCVACVVPIPTDTPMPPTSAPLPANTPVPTNARQAAPSSAPLPTQPVSSPPLEVQLYALEVGGRLQTLIDAVQAIGAMTQNPELASDLWKRDFATQLEIVRLVHQELTEMEVPIEMIGIHSAILNATSGCDLATDYVNRGIEYLDPADIQLATMLMIRCRENMSVPLKMINEYLDQSSLPVPITPIPAAPEPTATPTEPAPPAAPASRPA